MSDSDTTKATLQAPRKDLPKMSDLTRAVDESTSSFESQIKQLQDEIAVKNKANEQLVLEIKTLRKEVLEANFAYGQLQIQCGQAISDLMRMRMQAANV